jgi:hypothetical protein
MLVLMMVFRPGGIISDVRRKYEFEGFQNNNSNMR